MHVANHQARSQVAVMLHSLCPARHLHRGRDRRRVAFAVEVDVTAAVPSDLQRCNGRQTDLFLAWLLPTKISRISALSRGAHPSHNGIHH